jgi:Fic/DOC family
LNFNDDQFEDMDIHKPIVSKELREALSETDCWAVKRNEIENLSRLAFGGAHAPALRGKNMRAIIAGSKSGGAANRLADELQELAKQCAAMIAHDHESVLRAAAFFHLRFENIHPLVDCNGRVGRLLLSEQIRRTLAIELDDTLTFFDTTQPEYRAVFAADSELGSFVLLTKLLARHTNVELTLALPLPYPLSPIFPDKQGAAKLAKQNSLKQAPPLASPAFKLSATATALSKALKDQP